MKKKATRTYRDLKSRTTDKSRVRQYDRIPGEQFDIEKTFNEGYLSIDDSDADRGVVEVKKEDVEEAMPTRRSKVPHELFQDTSYTEAGVVIVSEKDVEEMYFSDEPVDATDAFDDAGDGLKGVPKGKKPSKRESDGCMLKRSEGSFADRIRRAMNPEDEMALDVGEDEVTPLPEVPEMEGGEMAAEGPCPAGCVTVEAPEVAPMPEEAGEEEGILELADDDKDVEFLEEEKEEEAREVKSQPEEEEMEADVEELATASTDTPIFEALGDIDNYADVSADRVDLVLTREASENPHYVVLIDGEPLAKIALNDQPEALTADHQDLFLDQDYPKYVIEGIEKMGLAETLKHVNARFYAATASKGEVAQQMRTAAVQELRTEHASRLAEMKDNLINTASVVLEGSLKNYILDNPLRDALIVEIRHAGVDENTALDMVERAFRTKGADYFRMILSKSEEWLGAPEGVLDHHIKEISSMNYRHPGYSRESEEEIVETHVAEARAVPRSVPIRTVASTRASEDGTTQREYWKSQLNLHGLLLQKSMANKPR